MENQYRSQTTGNVIDESESKLNISNIVLAVSKTMFIVSGVLLLILYFILYFKSDIPDILHIMAKVDDNPEILSRCYNISVISYNLNEMYDKIIDFIHSIPLY